MGPIVWRVVLNAGDRLLITVDQRSNIMLLDRLAHFKFNAGSNYHAAAHARDELQAEFLCPRHGDWYVVVEPGSTGSVLVHLEVVGGRPLAA